MKYHHVHRFKFIPLIALLAAAAAIVMLLWNALLPGLAGWSTVNYWQALGLLILCRLLFGGLHHGHPLACRGGRHRLHEKWLLMSREERETFIRDRMNRSSEDKEDPAPAANP